MWLNLLLAFFVSRQANDKGVEDARDNAIHQTLSSLCQTTNSKEMEKRCQVRYIELVLSVQTIIVYQ